MMKAVVLAFALLCATAIATQSGAELQAQVDAQMDAEFAAAVDSELEFNTHDADALEVDVDAADADAMELESETTTEAELVDSEEELADVEDESDAEFEAEGEAEGEAEAEAEAENKAEAKAELTMETVEAADLTAAEGNFAEVEAKKCTPAPTVMCPAGGASFAKVTRKPDSNGCGADGARILNDKLLGGKFTPCCNNHDLCYGAKTQGVAQKDTCDNNFYNCMKTTCGSGISATLCKAKAWVYYQAVSLAGCTAWTAAKIKMGC